MVVRERPPWWGVVAVVLLVLVNAGLVLSVVLQGAAPAPSPAVAAAATTTPRTTTPAVTSSAPATSTPTDAADEAVLAVYGDGYSSGNSEGGVGAAGWPALVAQELGMELQLSAATLAGYVNEGSTGQTYPQLAQAAPVAGASVTVVFGSRNDAEAAPEDVQAAATEMFEAIRAADPDTRLLVIGPCWSDADPPASLDLVSAAVQEAVTAAGGTYVDAVRWFADPAGLVSPVDGISLLDAGHAYLAALIAPLVSTELAR